MNGFKMSQIPRGRLLIAFGGFTVGGYALVNHCMYNVEGGHRAVLYNRFGGMSDKAQGEAKIQTRACTVLSNNNFLVCTTANVLPLWLAFQHQAWACVKLKSTFISSLCLKHKVREPTLRCRGYNGPTFMTCAQRHASSSRSLAAVIYRWWTSMRELFTGIPQNASVMSCMLYAYTGLTYFRFCCVQLMSICA